MSHIIINGQSLRIEVEHNRRIYACAYQEGADTPCTRIDITEDALDAVFALTHSSTDPKHTVWWENPLGFYSVLKANLASECGYCHSWDAAEPWRDDDYDDDDGDDYDDDDDDDYDDDDDD